MDVLEAILRRRSIRKFKDKEIGDEEIGELLRSVKWAPSAGNRQPWEVVAVKDEELKEELAEIALEQYWMTDAPVILVICVDKKRAEHVYGERGRELYGIQAAAAATQNILLRATEMGLGTSWVGAFDEGQASAALNCDDNIRPVAMVPVGYPDEQPEPPGRHDVTSFVHLNKFGKKDIGEWKGLVKHAKKAKRKTKKLLSSLKKY
ncbi:MAG: nitroreductase family protein [Candidatus Aenigmatarchaeota archaeon]